MLKTQCKSWSVSPFAMCHYSRNQSTRLLSFNHLLERFLVLCKQRSFLSIIIFNPSYLLQSSFARMPLQKILLVISYIVTRFQIMPDLNSSLCNLSLQLIQHLIVSKHEIFLANRHRDASVYTIMRHFHFPLQMQFQIALE